VLHSNHQHLVSPESANGCTERPTHERVEAARALAWTQASALTARRMRWVACGLQNIPTSAHLGGASRGTVVPGREPPL